jgi:hypothetical protein
MLVVFLACFSGGVVMPKRMTREDVVRLCAPFDQLAAAGYPSVPDAIVRLHNTVPLGAYGQRVLLLPGLFGTITSQDGLEITVLYRDAKAWLNTH